MVCSPGLTEKRLFVCMSTDAQSARRACGMAEIGPSRSVHHVHLCLCTADFIDEEAALLRVAFEGPLPSLKRRGTGSSVA